MSVYVSIYVENGTCYHKVIGSAEVNKSFSVVISFTYSMASYYVFISFVELLSSPTLAFKSPFTRSRSCF